MSDAGARPTVRGRGRVVAGLVLSVPVCAFLLTGGIQPADRALLHLLLAGCLLLAGDLRLPAELRRRWWGATGLLLAPVAVGLLPLPRSLLEVLSPGLAATWSTWSWFTLSTDPVATLETVVGLVGVAGWGLLAMACLIDARPERVERGIAWAGVGWAVVGVAHAAAGATRLFGVFPIRPPDGPFWAPLVNPNHHGVVLLAVLPFQAVVLMRARWLPERALLAAALVWTLIFPVVTKSAGLWVAASVTLAVAAGRAPIRRAWKVAAAIAGLAVAPLVLNLLLTVQPAWWRLSAAPRLQQWGDTWAVLRAHPWVGVGGGAYGVAYPPYRTVPTYALFEHAHSDLLEWVAETGCLGFAGLVAALMCGPRVLPGAGRPAWRVALVAILVHALVDFPLHITAVLLMAVGVFGGLLVLGADLSDHGLEPAPAVGRRRLATSVQIAAALLLSHHAIADRVARDAMTDPAAAACLGAWAPWRPERGWAAVVAAPAAMGPDEAERWLATWPADPVLPRLLAARAFAEGRGEQAEPWIRRSLARDPNDWRSWKLLAELQHLRGEDEEGATSMAEAMRHWPKEAADVDDALRRAWSWFPVGVWWLDHLQRAPARWSAKFSALNLHQQRPELALLASEQAARLRPDAHAWMPVRAQALLQLGLHQEARAYVRAWLRARPVDAWGWYAAALVAEVSPDADAPFERAVAAAGLLAMNEAAVRAVVARCGQVGCDGEVPAWLTEAWEGRGTELCEQRLAQVQAAHPQLRDLRAAMRWSCEAR